MNIADKVISIMRFQHALESILLTDKSTVQVNMVHLHYLLVLWNKLIDLCVTEQSTFGDAFVVESAKLKLGLVRYHSKICG